SPTETVFLSTTGTHLCSFMLMILLSPGSLIHASGNGIESRRRLRMEDCKPVLTPLSPGIKLLAPTEEEKKEFDRLNINYRSHTGLLNFLSCRTRPDLAPAVSILCSFNSNPGIKHWQQILHCWKYLKGTIDMKLNLRPDSYDNNNIKYFTDATWADDLESPLSRSGTICFWKSCPIAWKIPSEEMVADYLTKASNADSLRRLQQQCFLVLVSPS
ncbi:hypothetical protein VP01_6755g1, partial [Puccinia sorghi]